MANEEIGNPEEQPENIEAAAEEAQAAAEPTPEAAADAGAGDESLAVQLEKAQAEIAELKEQVLRTQAEQQNVRRRSEKEVENARKYALEKFAGDLLPVMDNLERTLDSADTENEALKGLVDGVELTRKSFADVLARFKVEAINPVGEPFDPQLHEAMSMIEQPDAEPNSVLHVVQKGYTLNGRLVRAAMVVVNKGGAKIDEQV